jgi:hypothetical protein
MHVELLAFGLALFCPLVSHSIWTTLLDSLSVEKQKQLPSTLSLVPPHPRQTTYRYKCRPSNFLHIVCLSHLQALFPVHQSASPILQPFNLYM